MRIEQLRQLPTFSVLPDDALTWLLDNSVELRLEPGAILFNEGAEARHFYILVEGRVQITKRVGGEETILATHERGAFTGEIPLLVGTPYIATARAVHQSHLLQIGAEEFENLLVTCLPIRHIIFSAMAQRLQSTEAQLRQREKLASLGTLAAGLAHELNNPAAAGRRAAGNLRETFRALLSLTLALNQQRLGPEQITPFVAAQRDLMESSAPVLLDPLEQSDLEDTVTDWLAAHDIEDGWKLAPSLVRRGLAIDWLDTIAGLIPNVALGDALRWLDATLTIAELLDEIEQSMARVSDLVAAVKSYSYMDQAPVQDVDVHVGIENTLTMLSYRLKQGIDVTRDYDRRLPRITVYGSELNQVWTNLLDNAIDALDGQGRIWIRTLLENDNILVEIADDGPGIPSDIQSRIFEPFFTTKGVGLGTGLGLDIAYRIIVQQHHGDIKVASNPGDTRFQIRLPIKQS